MFLLSVLSASEETLRAARESTAAPVLEACALVVGAIAQAGALALWANAGEHWRTPEHLGLLKQACSLVCPLCI